MARIVTHPLDTAKARLQAPLPTTPSTSTTMAYKGPFHVLRSTLQLEGLAGLYRGFGAVVLGGTPGTVLYLTSYDWAKEHLTATRQRQLNGSSSSSLLVDFGISFSSGMIAEAIACIIYVPVDVIKERLQIQRGTDKMAYAGSADAIRTIARTEGILALYKGYGATLLSFGTYSGFFFLFYEQFVAHVKRQQQQDTHQAIPFYWTLACSATAGSLASWLTSPLDMAKLRLQVQRSRQQQQQQSSLSSSLHNKTYHGGIQECLVHAYRYEGGWSGLFRGAGARVLHIAPATTVTMTSYELCRSFFLG